MGSSGYFNYPKEKMIELWKWAVEDGDIFDYYDAPVWLSLRDEIAERGIDKEKEVIEIDKLAIKKALKKDLKIRVETPMGRDDEAPSLTHWWWYLDLIAQGKYPLELLPEELKEIYLSSFHSTFSF